MSFYYGGPSVSSLAPSGTQPLTYKNLKAAGVGGYGFILYTQTFKRGTVVDANLIHKKFYKALHSMWRLDDGNLLERPTLVNVKEGLFNSNIVIRDEDDEMVDSVEIQQPINSFEVVIDDSNLHFRIL